MNKVADIVVNLYEATSRDKITWEETGKEGVFQTAFPGYTMQISLEKRELASVPGSIQFSPEENRTTLLPILRIFDAKGKLIEEISPEDQRLKELKADLAMREIHATARKQALNTEEAYDHILKHLRWSATKK